MTNNKKNICVFASSSNHLEEVFYKEARELGLLIGKNNYNIVYGGSKLGLMYACAGAVKEANGKIIGIMPEKIVSFGCANPEDCDEFIITAGMRERKAKIDELSDAFDFCHPKSSGRTLRHDQNTIAQIVIGSDIAKAVNEDFF